MLSFPSFRLPVLPSFRPPVLPSILPALPVLLAASLSGQTPDSAAGPSRPELTAQGLEAFLDGLVPLALKSTDVAGGVIAVVKDGKLLLAKGYGYADLAGRVPVDPDRTLFRVASISKLFNATAVMQLVEQGKLSLDEDITTYLDFELPRRYPDKITLRHILTHTAGFQESFKQLPADSGVPLREFVSRMTPDQIYRPGTVTSYSNYAVDLSGYIVQRASGMPFAEYVRVRILEPLGMRSSSIAQPLPADLMARVSKEYPTASDSAGEFEILQGEPSGNMSSTATDMARFAIAHLAFGAAPDGGRILAEATAREMSRTAFRTHPRVTGMGLGFFEEDRNGYRIIGHGGDLSRFHSHLSLLIDEGVGIFLSSNSSGRGASFFGFREAVINGFLDHYFPRATPLEPVMPNPAEISRRVAGHYTLSRRGETSLGRVIGLLVNLDVVARPEGSLEIPFLTGANGRPIRWWPIDSTTLRSDDGTQLMGYVVGAEGLPDRIGFIGGHELHRVGTLDSRPFNFAVLAVSLGAFAAVLILWPVAALIRRRSRVTWIDDGVGRPIRIGTRITAFLALGFVVAFGVFVGMGFRGDVNLDSRSDPLLAGIRVIGLLAALGTVTSVIALARSLRAGANGWARIKYLGLVAAGIGFTWFAIHWNLLSTNFRY
jgi:CubicO group peptidase (beta-lactamase class C family)